MLLGMTWQMHARTVLEQRTEVEQFFLEAMEQVCIRYNDVTPYPSPFPPEFVRFFAVDLRRLSSFTDPPPSHAIGARNRWVA